MSFVPTQGQEWGNEESRVAPPSSLGVNVTQIMTQCGFSSIRKDGADIDDSTTVGTCLSMGYPTPQPLFAPFEYSAATQVQHFTRPAAGMTLEDEARRPPRVLDISMKFLVDHVLRNPQEEWNTQYFRKFEYLWDRFRQVRQDWSAQTDTSHRRKKWLEFMIRVFALRVAACSRNEEDCKKFLDVKKNNSESLKDAFGQLASVYRSENKKRNNEMVAAGVLFHGLQLNAKIETYAGWLRTVAVRDTRTGEELLDLEHSSRSVDLVQVYKELDSIPCAAESSVVQDALLLLHTLNDGEWFRFLSLLWELDLPMILRCFATGIITYVRFRAIYDLFMSRRFRGHMSLEELSRRLMFDGEADCLVFCKRAGFPCTSFTNEDTGETELALQVTVGAEKKEVYSATEMSAKLSALEKAKYKLVFPIHRDFLEWEAATKLSDKQKLQRDLDLEHKAGGAAFSRVNAKGSVQSFGTGMPDTDTSCLMLPDGHEEEEESDDEAPPSAEPSYDPRSPECPIDFMYYLEIHFPPNLTFTHHVHTVRNEEGNGLTAINDGTQPQGFSISAAVEAAAQDENLRETKVIRQPKEFDDFAEAEFTDSSSCATSVSGIFGGHGAGSVPIHSPNIRWKLPGTEEESVPVEDGDEDGEEVPPPLPTFDEYVSNLLRQSEEVMQKLNCRDLYERRTAEKKELEIRQWELRAAKEIYRTVAPEESKQFGKLLTEAASSFAAIKKAAEEDRKRIESLLKERQEQQAATLAQQELQVKEDEDAAAKKMQAEEERQQVAADAFITATSQRDDVHLENEQVDVELSIPDSDNSGDDVPPAPAPTGGESLQIKVPIDLEEVAGSSSGASSISLDLTDEEEEDSTPEPAREDVVAVKPVSLISMKLKAPVTKQPEPTVVFEPIIKKEDDYPPQPTGEASKNSLETATAPTRRRLTREERRLLMCGTKTMDQILNPIRQGEKRRDVRTKHHRKDYRGFACTDRSTLNRTTAVDASLVDKIPTVPQDISPMPQWELGVLEQAALWYRTLPGYRRALLLGGDGEYESAFLHSQTPTNVLIDNHSGLIQLHTTFLVVGDLFREGAAPLTSANSTSRSIALMLSDLDSVPRLFLDDGAPVDTSLAVQKIKSRALTFQLEPNQPSLTVQSSVEVLAMDHCSVSTLEFHGVETCSTFFVVIIERNNASVKRGLHTLKLICDESNHVPGCSAAGFITQGVLVVIEDREDGDLAKLVRLQMSPSVHYLVLPVVDVVSTSELCGTDLPNLTSTTLNRGDYSIGTQHRKRSFPGQDDILSTELKQALKGSLDVLMAQAFQKNNLIADVGASFRTL